MFESGAPAVLWSSLHDVMFVEVFAGWSKLSIRALKSAGIGPRTWHRKWRESQKNHTFSLCHHCHLKTKKRHIFHNIAYTHTIFPYVVVAAEMPFLFQEAQWASLLSPLRWGHQFPCALSFHSRGNRRGLLAVWERKWGLKVGRMLSGRCVCVRVCVC